MIAFAPPPIKTPMLGANGLPDHNWINWFNSITQAILVSDPVETGMWFGWPSATAAPDGYLLCDGTSVSRTAYADLFAVIGTAHGSADADSFNVPDYRGYFIRGVDGGAGRDPDAAGRTAMATGGNTGDAVGSVQADAFEAHIHSTQTTNTSSAGSQYMLDSGRAGSTGPVVSAIPTTSTGGNESRPLNAYSNFIIKT